MYGGANCTRPVAHTYSRAVLIDGKYVEKEMYWMCEICFVEFARYVQENLSWEV